MLKSVNRITKYSVVLGSILLTSMGIGLAPARATMLRESNSLMLHPVLMDLFSSSDPTSRSGKDPTTSTTTVSANTDPVLAPEPTYTAGVLAFSVLGLGFLWKVLHKVK